MKILKCGGITVVSLLILLLSTGLFIPSFRYTVSVHVNASPGECWTILHDTSRTSHWVPGFESLTLKQGECKTKGAVYELIIRQDKLYIMQETIKEFNEPEKASYELINEVMKSDYDYTLVADNSGTEITSHFLIQGNNLFWKSMLFLSQSYLKSESQNQLNLLKLEIETGAPVLN